MHIGRKRTLVTIMAIALTLGMLSGCGSSKESKTETTDAQYGVTEDMSNSNVASDGMYTEALPAEGQEKVVEESAGAPAATDATQTVSTNRKLIRDASLTVETQEFDVLVKNIETQVKEIGGYMESSNVSGSGLQYESLRNAYFTARVPEDKLDEFINSVSEEANVTNKTESVTDVTLQYVDVESQKKSLEVEQERMMALLEKADTIETIVALESRLTEIRYQLQNLESQLRTYDNLVDYATVTISVQEVERLTPVKIETKWDKMTSGFMESLYNVGQGIVNFAIGVVIALPYLFICAVFGLVLYIIITSLIRRSNRKNAEKQRKETEQKTKE